MLFELKEQRSQCGITKAIKKKTEAVSEELVMYLTCSRKCQDEKSDVYIVLRLMGRLWVAGVMESEKGKW